MSEQENVVFLRAFNAFLKDIKPDQTGVYTEDGKTISWDKIIIHLDKYRITILSEEIVENLNKLIQEAIDNEDYETANELTKRLKEGESRPPGSSGGISTSG